MALYTEKNLQEAMNPLARYNGDNTFVKGQIYSMNNGGDAFEYSKNLKTYNKALEDAKGNDGDNFFTGVKDFFFGRNNNQLRGDFADEYTKAYKDNPYLFDTNSYNEGIKNAKSEQDFNKGTLFNGGLVGGLLNHVTQAGKTAADFTQALGKAAQGRSDAWDEWNKRDHLSDAGAGAELLLDVATLGTGLLGKSVGKTIAKNAALGAGYGLAGGIRDMGSENFDAGNLALTTALGAGLGGALGGAGYAGKKAWDKYALPDNYQDMLRAGQDKVGVREGLSNIRKNLASRKNAEGTKVGRLLKSTPAKVGYGIGGGMLLNNLLGGGANAQPAEMSEQELYNYIINGGY